MDLALSFSVLLREDASSPILSAWIAATEWFAVGLLFVVRIAPGACIAC